MARNNRLWQDSLAHIKFFDGDQNECDKWYAWAKQKLGFMLRSTPGPATQVFAPSSDVLIKIDTRPNRIYIVAGGSVYLESGFLDHLTNGAIGAANTYKPSVIKFNTFTATTSQILVNAAFNRIVAEGDSSISVGCTTKLLSVDTSDGFNEYHFESDTPEFCDPGVIRNKKLCQLYAPPSSFTGKMRLFIQALYGSKREDYLGAMTAGQQPFVKIDTGFRDQNGKIEYAFINSGLPTSGLYKDPSDKYWLVDVDSNRVDVRPMKSSLYGKKLKVKMKESEALAPDIADLEEAYLLASLKPSHEVSQIYGSTIPTGFAPLAYGWKFNNKGDRCSIVVVRAKNDIPCTLGYGPSATNSTAVGIESLLITLYFGWDDQNNRPKVTKVESSAGGAHIPYLQNKILYPIFSGFMKCLTPGTGDGQNGKSADLNCLIYCYYDKFDNLVTWTAKNGKVNVQPATTEYSPAGRDQFWIAGMNMKDDVTTVSKAWGRTIMPDIIKTNKTGFYSASQDEISSQSSIGSGVIQYIDAWYELAPLNTTSYTVNGDFTLAFYDQYYSQDPAVPSYYQSNIINPQRSVTSTFVIPFFDAEAVSIANEVSATVASESNLVGFGADSTVPYTRVHSCSIVGGQVTPGGFLYEQVYTKGFSGPGSFGNPATSSPSEEQLAILEARREYKNSKEQTAKIYSSRLGSDGLSIYTQSSDVPIEAMPLDALFNITFADPVVPYAMPIVTGHSSGIKYSIAGVSGSRDWPAEIFTTVVGWT